MEPRLAAALSYLGLCFTGLFFFFRERQNRLVRFSAAQSIVLFIPLIIIFGILKAIIGFIGSIWVIGWIIAPLLSLVLTLLGFVVAVVWIYLMVRTYLTGTEVRLPFVGDYAERLLGLFSPKQRKGAN
jgi:uncharacterized membrane protein